MLWEVSVITVAVGMQRVMKDTLTTGTRGSGWGEKSVLHWHAGKMARAEVNIRSLNKRNCKASCQTCAIQTWWNLNWINFSRCANYVCSETSEILGVTSEHLGVQTSSLGDSGYRAHVRQQVLFSAESLPCETIILRHCWSLWLL